MNDMTYLRLPVEDERALVAAAQHQRLLEARARCWW